MARKKTRNSKPIQIFVLALLSLSCFGSVQAEAQVPAGTYGNPAPAVSSPVTVETSQLPVLTLFQRSKDIKKFKEELAVSHPNVEVIGYPDYSNTVQKSGIDRKAGRDFTPGFYLYTVSEDELDEYKNEWNLDAVSSRCNIPSEEIALLNDLTSLDEDLLGKTLIIPDTEGIFVPLNPTTSIGTLVKKRLFNPDESNIYVIDGKEFQFFPGERLTPTERAFFLDTTLRMPLDNSVLTSGFGQRVSPITGMEHKHKGIDLAAPEGTSVYACKGGTVAIATYDKTYGNYIVLDHENKTQSVYAHLSSMLVKTGEEVLRGSRIGRVGTTGASTGPHLHFEIRMNGSAMDPRRLLPAI